MRPKRALIIGVTGQDGAYLSRLLLSKGYEVHGLRRRSSTFNTSRIDELVESGQLKLHYGDLTDSLSLIHIFLEIKPEEIYNLGAQSHVAVSFLQPEYTANVDALGTLRVLEAVRISKLDAKVYQASTSELFGSTPGPQSELTKFNPQSPYAVAKNFGFEIAKLYRDAYGIFVSNGILFNHESPMRGKTFVTRKITVGLASFLYKNGPTIELGNLDSQRDWGHARDFVESQWLMLQNQTPGDFVVATGKTRSIRDFCESACSALGLELSWIGKGLEEKGILADGRIVFEVNKKYFRPLEVDHLLGDASKAHSILGWHPRTDFETLVNEMILFDVAEATGSVGDVKWTN